MTHGGMPNSPGAITKKPGTEAIPADFDVLEEETLVVPCLNIKVPPGEIPLNLGTSASDTEKPVCTVYSYGAFSTADNIPVMLTNRCLPERGVDTAMYLIIKHTDGYVISAGGVAADSGNPDRDVYVDKPFGSIILDELHYGSIHIKVPGKTVHTIKVMV